MEKISLAVIGGSGIYSMTEMAETKEYNPDTPFGQPSAPIIVGTIDGKRIAFLARHGLGHHIMPEEVNYRSNIFALKMLGVTRIISISACGSLREDYAPGDIVVPDQVFDYTKKRERTFFGEGLVAHVGVADPFCADLSRKLKQSVLTTGAICHEGGSIITVEGPRFSTKAESNTFRSWGMSIIGMTTSPEVFLAREAEMCYAVMAHVTDYDVWHISEAPVSVEMVIQILKKNNQIAQTTIHHLVGSLSDEHSCDCRNAMAKAVITNSSTIPQKTKEKLSLLVGKYI